MKKLFLIIAAISASFIVNAQKVALHSASGIQHFTGTDAFVDAYNASLSGDTIYLPGGGFNTPGNIDKSLIVYGAGHYPDSTQATAKTFVNGTINLSENADGFRLEGVDINGHIYFDNNEQVDNVTIKYCKMNDLNIQGNLTTPSTNLTLINNVFTGAYFYLSNAQNTGVFNCIIQGRVINSYGNVFENNIFMYSYSGTSSNYTTAGDNNTFNNNVFLNASYRYFNGISNIIKTNIFVTTPNYGTTPQDSVNYFPVDQADIFVNQTGNAFDYAHDYHLQNPSIYPGTDGTQAGLYGGTHGYKEGAVPSNPHIQLQIIAPTTTTEGMLNIQIRTEAQDY